MVRWAVTRKELVAQILIDGNQVESILCNGPWLTLQGSLDGRLAFRVRSGLLRSRLIVDLLASLAFAAHAANVTGGGPLGRNGRHLALEYLVGCKTLLKLPQVLVVLALIAILDGFIHLRNVVAKDILADTSIGKIDRPEFRLLSCKPRLVFFG